MFFNSTYIRPGRRSRLSGPMTAFIIILLLFQGSIMVYAVTLALKTRVQAIWLDPYLSISIEGADGYAVSTPAIDEDAFRNDFEELLLSRHTDISQEDARKISQKVADSVVYETYIKKVDGSTAEEAAEEEESRDEQEEDENEEDSIDLPLPGISNGDTVTIYADISEDAWNELREQDIYFMFECNPVALTAEGLPEADPYDPFEDLNLTFSGLSGAGTVTFYYNGVYPFVFDVQPTEELSNGDTVNVKVSFSEGYDLDQVIEEYHIMPVALSKKYVISGLYKNPVDIESFSDESRETIMQQGRLAAQALLEQEYKDDERFVLDDAGMYFAVSTQALAHNPADSQGTAGTGLADSTQNDDGSTGFGLEDSNEDSETQSASGTTVETIVLTDGTRGTLLTDGTGSRIIIDSDGNAEAAEVVDSLETFIDDAFVDDTFIDDTAAAAQAEDAVPTVADPQNYLFCLFRVNYTNDSGENLEYYYYVRFDNLMLNDAGEVIADFSHYTCPEKPSVPIIGEAFGDGASVSVPGILSFRSLAGYESKDELIRRVITPLEATCNVTSIQE